MTAKPNKRGTNIIPKESGSTKQLKVPEVQTRTSERQAGTPGPEI